MGRVDELLARLGKAAGDAPSPQVIRAYHGSPYDFDRFDASKIGTGEGAQAYGHGLYFAGNEGVARQYRDSLKDILDTDPTERQALDLQDAWNDWMAKQQLAREWEKPKGGLSNLLAELGEPNPHLAAERAAAARWMQLNSEIERATKNPGRVYEVEIGYPEDSLLDLDVPMWQQSDRVRSGLSKIDPRQFGAVPHDGGLVRGLRWKTPWDTLIGNPVQGKSPDELTFFDTVEKIKNSRVTYSELAALAKSEAKASAAMRDAGIPGIRYFDAGSRAAGDGTRNYVIFPGAEDQIRILRKYGLLAPIPAAAAMSGEE